MTPHERELIQERYRSLKDDLTEAAKAPYVHDATRNRELTLCESAFYDPALRKAKIALRPATNSNPISPRWFSAIYEAQSEFSYMSHNLAGALKEK